MLLIIFFILWYYILLFWSLPGSAGFMWVYYMGLVYSNFFLFFWENSFILLYTNVGRQLVPSGSRARLTGEIV
jgi:hypothetical protein